MNSAVLGSRLPSQHPGLHDGGAEVFYTRPSAVSALALDGILYDDGEFYIEANANPGARNGFLQRRCRYGVTTPGGFECLGGYDQRWIAGNQRWIADVHVLPGDNNASDCLSLGQFDSQAAAVKALWDGRSLAHQRHRD